ncbi:uncharacterized protein LOC114871982 isoform X1 [Osmia bicornis bicornis]|uniref:uncharacterized protein LOC114871982 isoform X1 n=1 Tax=Osmia bicornis bicornis TaxID=1437191 RepID=UPI0010F544FA|nr:uncharacterized protein LOC114871982 isoform X1 [Osmia bicornis bicornis]
MTIVPVLPVPLLHLRIPYNPASFTFLYLLQSSPRVAYKCPSWGRSKLRPPLPIYPLADIGGRTRYQLLLGQRAKAPGAPTPDARALTPPPVFCGEVVIPSVDRRVESTSPSCSFCWCNMARLSSKPLTDNRIEQMAFVLKAQIQNPFKTKECLILLDL